MEDIRHFRFILEGQSFTVYTDHKPLLGALAKVSDPWTAHQCRHLAYADIQHVAGQENVAANALSQLSVSSITAPPSAEVAADLRGIAARQASCPSTRQAVESPSLQVRTCEVEGVSLLCDMSSGRLRPLVPQMDRLLVFRSIHGMAHPGIRAMHRIISARFLCPGMQKDIAAWCRDCVACQRAKVTKQPPVSVQPIPIPTRRFSHVHVDLVGPLPVSEDGFIYIMTMVDRTSRRLEAVLLKEISTASCICAFLDSWVVRFGVQETITTDRGAQFTSASWASFCSSLGTRYAMTTAYYPQANGLVERTHRQLKDVLHAQGAGVDWLAHLPCVLLGLRAVPKEISGVSSAKAILGQPLVLPGSGTSWRENMPPPTCQPRTYAEAVSGPPDRKLQRAQMVNVKTGGCGPPLAPAYSGPYRVVRPGYKYLLVEVGGR